MSENKPKNTSKARKNQFNGDFSVIQDLDIKTVITIMEQSKTVPTPISTPIYDGWTALVVKACLVDTNLVSRVFTLQTKWETELAFKLAENRKKRKLRTPKWLSKEEKILIVQFYKETPEGYHVDHIIPLLGENVSGLHVLSNLQYLPARENLKKSNKYE